MGDRGTSKRLWSRAVIRLVAGENYPAIHDFPAWKLELSEIFVSDGSKCDTGNILDIFGDDNARCH